MIKKPTVFIFYVTFILTANQIFCQNSDPVSNLHLVRHFFIDGYGARDYKVIKETISEDYVGYSNGQINNLKGPEAQIKGIEVELKIHPDFRIKIDDIFPSAENKVTVRWTARWTDQKSGKEAVLYGIWIAEVKNNKIIKSWNVFDLLGTNQRLVK